MEQTAKPRFDAAFELLRQQRFGEAAPLLEVLLPDAPALPEIWHWLGFLRWKQGRLAEAEQLMARALQAQPGNPTFLVNQGAMLVALDRPAAALRLLQEALVREPSLASAHNNLANALRALGQIDAAGRHYEAALLTQANSPEAHNNLANIRKEQGDVDGALQHYQQALALRPDFREAFSNLLALTKLVDTMPQAAVLELHRRFAERFETPLLQQSTGLLRPPRSGQKLRIAYLSPDCHPAASFFLEPVLAHHDRDRVEVFAYFDGKPQAAFSPQTLARVACRALTGLTDAEVADMIRADGVDVLVDIAGHAGRSRILVLARKPAPLQITWLDYLGTTGLRAVDFRLTDQWADPPGAERNHSEALLRMPAGYCQWCYPGPSAAMAVGELPAAHNGLVTFGSFNNPIKISASTLALWSRVLAAVPNSRLRCVGVGSEIVRAKLRRHFARQGQEERLELLPRLPYRDFLAACNEVDLVLDTLLFSGATTSCDVLWMGVPVLTLPGSIEMGASASRSTASILSCLGLQALVAASADAYVDIARAMAGDLPRLAALRASLRQKMRASPLMDGPGFTRAVEDLLRQACYAVDAKSTNGSGVAAAGRSP